MRRIIARTGLGVSLLAGPALAGTPAEDTARLRAVTLDRLHARLIAERTEAQDLAERLARTAPIRDARAARPE